MLVKVAETRVLLTLVSGFPPISRADLTSLLTFFFLRSTYKGETDEKKGTWFNSSPLYIPVGHPWAAPVETRIQVSWRLSSPTPYLPLFLIFFLKKTAGFGTWFLTTSRKTTYLFSPLFFFFFFFVAVVAVVARTPIGLGSSKQDAYCSLVQIFVQALLFFLDSWGPGGERRLGNERVSFFFFFPVDFSCEWSVPACD